MTLAARPPDTPACQGRWDLFDSRHPADHALAAAICKACPVRDWCAGQLQATVRNADHTADAGPEGTWAGRLIGGRQREYLTITELVDGWTPNEARRAHAAYNRGIRDAWANTGHRVYIRMRDQATRARREAVA